jgi:homoserine dehydrogenase
MELPPSHPFAHLTEGENCVLVYTESFCDKPLVIHGPPENRAAGLFADVIRLAQLVSPPI